MSNNASNKPIPEQLTDALAEVKTLQGQVTDLTGKLTAAQTALTDAQAAHAKEKAALEKQAADAKAEATAKAAEVVKLQAEAKTADERATQIAASAGVPPVAKPDKDAAGAEATETLEQVRAKLATERDPVARGKLAAKAAELRAKK